jgi:CRP-like cAMP-binding protein
MYDIRSGSVGIYEAYGTQEEKLLTQLYANQFFGELGMIDNVERSCTAVVMENGTELENSRKQYEGYQEEKKSGNRVNIYDETQWY